MGGYYNIDQNKYVVAKSKATSTMGGAVGKIIPARNRNQI
jgi:hypothetical protein